MAGTASSRSASASTMIGVLAAHLGDDPLDVALARPHRRRRAAMMSSPTAFDPVNVTNATVGVLDQRGPDLLADAGQEREHAGRQARLEEDLDQPRRDARRLLRRLEHDGVAGHERRRHHAGRDREREVPRRDDDADARGWYRYAFASPGG